MQEDLKDFWGRFQQRVDVIVASRDSEQLLGVRDGFRRYLLRGLGHETVVSVQSGITRGSNAAIWTSAADTLAAANRQAADLRRDAADGRAFYVGTEEGLSTLEIGGVERNFVHCWTVVSSPVGTACGGSGPVEIPDRFTQSLDRRGPVKVPGTRRRGGMLGSLTGGLESRREACAQATFHALSSLFFGLVESRDAVRWDV